MSSRLSDYDYELPEELIAQRPLPRRQDSRMMVLYRQTQRIEHRRFAEIGTFLRDGDLLVLNNARVIAARRLVVAIILAGSWLAATSRSHSCATICSLASPTS